MTHPLPLSLHREPLLFSAAGAQMVLARHECVRSARQMRPPRDVRAVLVRSFKIGFESTSEAPR
jgi:hypothetical protein